MREGRTVGTALKEGGGWGSLEEFQGRDSCRETGGEEEVPYWNRVPQEAGLGQKDSILQLEEEVISSESPGLTGKDKSWHTAERKYHLISKFNQSCNCRGTCPGRPHPISGWGWGSCLSIPLHRLLPSLSFTSSSGKPSPTTGSELRSPFLLTTSCRKLSKYLLPSKPSVFIPSVAHSYLVPQRSPCKHGNACGPCWHGKTLCWLIGQEGSEW